MQCTACKKYVFYICFFFALLLKYSCIEAVSAIRRALAPEKVTFETPKAKAVLEEGVIRIFPVRLGKRGMTRRKIRRCGLGVE